MEPTVQSNQSKNLSAQVGLLDLVIQEILILTLLAQLVMLVSILYKEWIVARSVQLDMYA